MKKSIVSSYCVLSVTSIVIDCNIAFVSLNSGNVPIAAFATDGDDVSCVVVEVSIDAASRDCCNSDRLVVTCSAVVVS